MKKVLGERITKLLIKNNISQKTFADTLGVSEATISRYLADEREPKPEMLANIATALGTTSDYLLGIDEENDDYSYAKVRMMLARHSSGLSNDEKKELMSIILEGF